MIDLIGLTGMATVKERVSIRQKSTKHTVFGVEDCQMLVQYHFEFVSSFGPEKFSQAHDLINMQ